MSASKAKVEANARYDSKAYDKILIRIRKDGVDGITREMLTEEAKRQGKSINQFIVDAIRKEFM